MSGPMRAIPPDEEIRRLIQARRGEREPELAESPRVDIAAMVRDLLKPGRRRPRPQIRLPGTAGEEHTRPPTTSGPSYPGGGPRRAIESWDSDRRRRAPGVPAPT